MIILYNFLSSFLPSKPSPQHHTDEEKADSNEECYKKPGKTAHSAPFDEAKGGCNVQYSRDCDETAARVAVSLYSGAGVLVQFRCIMPLCSLSALIILLQTSP
ncbi:MAG: hypothetical protein R6U85_01005 [Salinivirgaceae bacterium]